MKQKKQKKSEPNKLHHRAKLLLLPHKHNNYQPHLTRPIGLAIVIACVLVVQAFYNLSNTGLVLGDASNVTTDRLLALTNQARRAEGRAPLTVDNKLAAAASLKAEDMLRHNYWAHNSPSGVEPWTWIEKTEYSYSYAGENLAKDFGTAESVTAAWMNSNEHRKNMLSDHYQNVGFAIAPGVLDGKPTTLVVAMYGAPKTTATLTATEEPTVLAATTNQSLIAQLGEHLQAMSPIALGSIVLLLVAAMVAAIAQVYRKRLPKNMQQSWRKHHGAYKAFAMTSLAVMFVALYSVGGQI